MIQKLPIPAAPLAPEVESCNKMRIFILIQFLVSKQI